MNCEKCGTNKIVHDYLFCPKCDIEAIQPKVTKVYDLYKIMYHMEANGYMSKEKFWNDYFINEHDTKNDLTMYIELNPYVDHLDSKLQEEIREYFTAMKRILNLEKNENSICVEISW